MRSNYEFWLVKNKQIESILYPGFPGGFCVLWGKLESLGGGYTASAASQFF